jgi:hypothetical protein
VETLQQLCEALGLPEGTEITFSVEGSKGAVGEVALEVDAESQVE